MSAPWFETPLVLSRVQIAFKKRANFGSSIANPQRMKILTQRLDCPFSLMDPSQAEPHTPAPSTSTYQTQTLWARGTRSAFKLLDQLPTHGLAIVGTRQALSSSSLLIRDTLDALSAHPFGRRLIIVSGLARGIDAVAHEAAIQAGLSTIAWLGTPLDHLYPRATLGLRQQILNSDGLLLSHLPPGAPVYPSHFLLRNRSIVASSSAVWIVQAGIPSGALSTAQWAQDLGCPCFATPSQPDDPSFEGNQKLLETHAAEIFWGPQTLGSVWLDLATTRPKTQQRQLSTTLQKLRKNRGKTSAESTYRLLLQEGHSPLQSLQAIRQNPELITHRINNNCEGLLEKREEFRLD